MTDLQEDLGSKNHARTRIRGMGCHEAYQMAMHTLDQYRGTIVACRYCPPPSLSRPESIAILKETIYDSIARVVIAQPHLQMGIVGENSKDPGFVRLDRLDLANHVNWISIDASSQVESRYLDLIQSQLDLRYENLSTEPGWRVVILHNAEAESLEMLYVWNHVHHDGMSGKIFHQHLLRQLRESSDPNKEPLPRTSKESNSWVLELSDPSDRLPPNPELLSSWPMSPVFMVKSVWKEIKPAWFYPPSKVHATWAPIQSSPYKTRFCNFKLDNDTVTRVVHACRQYNTTVTGLIQALALVSHVSALKDMNGFASRTPYDLRHVLPSNTQQYPWLRPKDSMCNYVSVLEHEFDPQLVESIRSKMPSQSSDARLSTDLMEIIWSVSARIRREIRAKLDAGERNDLIGIMKFVSDWRTQQQSETHKARYLSWLVTNLGVLDGRVGDVEDEENAWSIREGELVLSAEVPSAAFSISVLTVKGEKMVVTCSWQDCVVDSGIAEHVMSDLERWLMEIGS